MADTARAPTGAEPRWRRRLRTGARVRREAGLLGVGVLVVQRMEPAIGLHAEWYVVLEGVVRDSGEPFPAGSGTRWAGPGDLELLARFGRPHDELRARLARGDHVAVLESGEELVAYAWYRSGAYDEDATRFELGGREAWLYDGLVAEAHRGRRVWSAFYRASAADLASRGVTRILSAIDMTNRPSLRAARARGATVAGRVAMVRWLGLSVRREAWAGRAPRWRIHRGSLPAALPPAR